MSSLLRFGLGGKEKYAGTTERRSIKRIEWQKAYYKEHREELIKYHHEYYAKNREKINERKRKKAKSDKEVRLAKKNERNGL